MPSAILIYKYIVTHCTFLTFFLDDHGRLSRDCSLVYVVQVLKNILLIISVVK